MNRNAWPDDKKERGDCLEDNASGEPFHIGQPYEKKTARPLRCKCGSAEFHLAQGDYYTAVRCIKCRMEVCVHEG